MEVLEQNDKTQRAITLIGNNLDLFRSAQVIYNLFFEEKMIEEEQAKEVSVSEIEEILGYDFNLDYTNFE